MAGYTVVVHAQAAPGGGMAGCAVGGQFGVRFHPAIHHAGPVDGRKRARAKELIAPDDANGQHEQESRASKLETQRGEKAG